EQDGRPRVPTDERSGLPGPGAAGPATPATAAAPGREADPGRGGTDEFPAACGGPLATGPLPVRALATRSGSGRAGRTGRGTGGAGRQRRLTGDLRELGGHRLAGDDGLFPSDLGKLSRRDVPAGAQTGRTGSDDLGRLTRAGHRATARRGA